MYAPLEGRIVLIANAKQLLGETSAASAINVIRITKEPANSFLIINKQISACFRLMKSDLLWI
jgi:hypothetical protein